VRDPAPVLRTGACGTSIRGDQYDQMENPEEVLTHLRSIYPNLSDMEVKEAGRNLCGYIEIVFEIQREQLSSQIADIDSIGTGPTIEERSNSQNN